MSNSKHESNITLGVASNSPSERYHVNRLELNYVFNLNDWFIDSMAIMVMCVLIKKIFSIVDDLSRLDNEKITSKEMEIDDLFPDEKLWMRKERPWFANISKFKVTGVVPEDYNGHQRRKIFNKKIMSTYV